MEGRIGIQGESEFALRTRQTTGAGDEGAAQRIQLLKGPPDRALLGRAAHRLLHLHLQFPAEVMRSDLKTSAPLGPH